MAVRSLVLTIAGVAATCAAALPTVLVTGATGGTGALTYHRLKSDGLWTVRAFVRNATKAKQALGCERCDESEEVFVGDLSDVKSVEHAMEGVDTLVIVTASQIKCTGTLPFPFGTCSYDKGATPKDIDWLGTKAQIRAFASAPGNLAAKQVVFVSSGLTTSPDNTWDKIGNGHSLFYKLNAEASIMSSGLPWTIVKPCGLGDGAAGKNKLIVGHDDEGFNMAIDHTIQRDDLARVIVEAVRAPKLSVGLRFDVCSQFLGAPTTDIVHDVLKAARFPWDTAEPAMATQSIAV